MKKQLKIIKKFYKQDGHIKFNKTHVLFHDSELFVQIPYKSELDVVVDAAALLNLFESDINFKISIEENNILLTNKMLDIHLPIIDISIPDVEKVHWKLLPTNFMNALDFCSFSISDSTSDGLLTCFYINNNVYSCDNYRITEYILSEEIDSFLLPNIFYKRIKHIKWTHYNLSSNALYFKSDNIVIKTNIINDNYIDTSSLFDTNGIVLTADLDNIKTLIEHAGFLIPTNKRSREEFVILKFDKHNINCINKQAKGSSNELIHSEINYDPFSFKINPHLFNQIINKADKIIVGEATLLFIGKDFRHSLCVGGD